MDEYGQRFEFLVLMIKNLDKKIEKVKATFLGSNYESFIRFYTRIQKKIK